MTICAKIGNIRTISKYTNAKGLSRKKYVVHRQQLLCNMRSKHNSGKLHAFQCYCMVGPKLLARNLVISQTQ